ncbi:MAG: hypothetical protein WBE37_20630 [Bryobacteraceae bacterium]
MKTLLSTFVLSLAAWTPMHAADLQAHWNDLCHVAAGRQVGVTTSDGKTVTGSCLATSSDELSLVSTDGVVKIARSTLTRIQVWQPGNRHHLKDLGNNMDSSFQLGFAFLRSPAAPIGLAIIPATVAWGAVAAPFCALADIAGQDGAVIQDVKVTD